eukprot:scaffold7461_cov417-Prasinococcus_capsulatus_cf.AAC.3
MSEQFFWHNNVTGESTFEHPPVVGLKSEDGNTYYIDPSTGTPPPQPSQTKAPLYGQGAIVEKG